MDESEVVRLPIGCQIVPDPGVQGGDDVAICSRIAASGGISIPVGIDGYKVGILVTPGVGGVDAASRTVVIHVGQCRYFRVADLGEVVDVVTDFMVAHDRVPQEVGINLHHP